MPEFAFDIVLNGALRVNAPTEVEARKTLAAVLDCADSNLGAWPDGNPILAELSLTGNPSLYEIDGVEPPVTLFAYGGEFLFAEGKRFRIFEEPARGYRIARLADGADATFHGDDSCERFRDHFTGDEFAPDDPSDYAEEADDFGDWCEANGELPPLRNDAASFSAAGFTVWQSGGGCTAWRREINAERYILVTGLDGCCHELASQADRYLVGLHQNAEADSWPASDFATAAEAIAAADGMRAANE